MSKQDVHNAAPELFDVLSNLQQHFGILVQVMMPCTCILTQDSLPPQSQLTSSENKAIATKERLLIGFFFFL